MRNAWRIPGGEGAAANTANRRVLVTDKNGRQSVQTVNHELGMNARDMKDVRGRLARQGLAADDDVGMYGGVDTRDKPFGTRPRGAGGAPSGSPRFAPGAGATMARPGFAATQQGSSSGGARAAAANNGFDPFAALRSVVYDPPVSVEQLGQRLQVSMAPWLAI